MEEDSQPVTEVDLERAIQLFQVTWLETPLTERLTIEQSLQELVELTHRQSRTWKV